MKTSKLWETLSKETFAKIDEDFLAHFREPGNANNRLAAWDPNDRSMRFFKFLLFQQLEKKDEEFFEFYRRLGNTSVGNPVFLRGPQGEAVNLDHFFSVEEIQFLKQSLNFPEIRSVVEIGAGFGRTAQAVVKLNPALKKYTIIDLPSVLSLSRAYLPKVLTDEELAKIEFVNAEALPNAGAVADCDLSINIDSFQEMPPETVRFYLDEVVGKSRFFYSKNAIGKYRPESVGLYGIDESKLLDVFALGLSRDVIDIFDPRELAAARRRHASQYCPSTAFSLLRQEPLGIFPYYQNLLYQRKEGTGSAG